MRVDAMDQAGIDFHTRRCLEGLGHEVIVADPGFAPMYGMRRRRVKTDVPDARALRSRNPAALAVVRRPAG